MKRKKQYHSKWILLILLLAILAFICFWLKCCSNTSCGKEQTKIEHVDPWVVNPQQEDFPSIPSKQPGLDDFIKDAGYPYWTDTVGGIFNPNQLIVKLRRGFDGEDLRSDLIEDIEHVTGKNVNENQVRIKVCDCNPELVLADMDSDLLAPGDIVEVKEELRDTTDSADDAEFNYYSGHDLQKQNHKSYQQKISNDLLKQDAKIKIAILDTGIDIEQTNFCKFQEYLLASQGACGLNTHGTGYDFIHNDAEPWDDQSHGTHVSGILIDAANSFGVCDFGIIPIKTHNYLGIGTLFDVICGTYFAVYEGADIINDSWGFYGLKSSQLLEESIREAQNNGCIIVSAMGNDTKNISVNPFYPAALDSFKNVIPVASVNEKLLQLSTFSNWAKEEYYVAKGQDILNSVPAWWYNNQTSITTDPYTGIKSGTSMATPLMTAAIAKMLCCDELEMSKDNPKVSLKKVCNTYERASDGDSEPHQFYYLELERLREMCNLENPDKPLNAVQTDTINSQ